MIAELEDATGGCQSKESSAFSNEAVVEGVKVKELYKLEDREHRE